MLKTAALMLWLQFCCARFQVEPAFALAVAHVESRTASQEFRYGPMGRHGRYVGPFGIHRDFRAKWPNLDDPFVNIWVGVRALRGENKKKVLRRYNANFTQAYWLAVKRAWRKYEATLKAIEDTP